MQSFNCSNWFLLLIDTRLGLQRLNLCLERLILLQLALEEAAGHGHLLGNACRREDVHVFELVFAVMKVIELDEAFVDERIEAVVKTPEAHV